MPSFLLKQTEYLEHTLSTEGIKPNINKISVIENLEISTISKRIKSFLGITGYYRKFIKDYAKIALLLINALKKDSKINPQNPKYIYAFEKLKQLISKGLVDKQQVYEKLVRKKQRWLTYHNKTEGTSTTYQYPSDIY